MSTKIALVAACDRNNYGDVLMPILFEEYYRKNANGNASFQYFASSYADLQDIGGRKTQPINKITGEYKCVIVAGGEVLTPSYFGMYMNLQTNKMKLRIFRRISLLSKEFANSLCKMLLHGETKMPWTIYPRSESQEVYYNSVGGQNIKSLSEESKNEIKEIINTCTCISVRDDLTYSNIKELDENDKVSLKPDTAIIMSKLYDSSRLTHFISHNAETIRKKLGQYYVVQVNNYFGSELIQDISVAINKVYKEYNYKCLLLPIGRVQGHEDEIPLEKVYNLCDEGAACLLQNNNIYDVMYLISNAMAFLGTSLHGVITAASYLVPHTVIAPKCEKTRIFINTWHTSSVDTVRGTSGMISFITSPNITKTVKEDAIKGMQSMVQDHFDKLIARIDS